jgi:octaprenyl-diphosphate synthase
VRYAAAIELLHNATLFHDDVVDGATLRRGRPTVAALLNPRAAVLIGDFGLVRCVSLVLEARVEPEKVLRRFAATLSHLAEGELRQMELAGLGTTTREDYFRIVYGKTASLFVTAAVSAAISVQAPEPLCKAAETFAARLGTAFQIKDDIFDYASDAALGKPAGIDLREQKITLPLLCALDSVPAAEAAEVRALVGRISDEPALADRVRAFVLERDGVGQAVAEMEKYIDGAASCLEALPSSAEKPYLVELARYVGERNY